MTDNGRLNILGLFDRFEVNPNELPYTHPQLYIVLFADGEEADNNTTFGFTIRFSKVGKKKPLLTMEGGLQLSESSLHNPRLRIPLGIGFLKIEELGVYSFTVDAGAGGKQTAYLEVIDSKRGMASEQG